MPTATCSGMRHAARGGSGDSRAWQARGRDCTVTLAVSLVSYVLILKRTISLQSSACCVLDGTLRITTWFAPGLVRAWRRSVFVRRPAVRHCGYQARRDDDIANNCCDECMLHVAWCPGSRRTRSTQGGRRCRRSTGPPRFLSWSVSPGHGRPCVVSDGGSFSRSLMLISARID